MGVGRSTFGRGGEVHTRFLWGKPEVKSHLEDPGVDGRIILRWIFSKWDMGHGLDQYGSGLGQVSGTCECCNETSGYRKSGRFLDWLQTGCLLKKDCATWTIINSFIKHCNCLSYRTSAECYWQWKTKALGGKRVTLSFRPKKKKTREYWPGIETKTPPAVN